MGGSLDYDTMVSFGRLFRNPFGYYRFDSVRVGEIYVFSISAKEHQFQTQVFTVNDDITDLNFTALP